MLKRPRIGMRIVKSALAVFLSISVFLILLWVDDIFNYQHDDFSSPSNMYTPFFAGIAAIYALHSDPKSSLKQAKIRSFGSIVGGYFGMIILMLSDYLFLDNVSNVIAYKALHFALVSFGMIPLIHLTVVMKHTTASFISGLTYLSVTISIRNGGMPAFQFATNRILSTLVGVGIALLVNNFTLHFHRNKNVLFVSSLDNNMLDKNHQITPFMKYKLNNLFYSNMNLSFATTRTLSSLEYIFDNVHVEKDMVIMNGSAIYNFEKKEYSNVIFIKKSSRLIIDQACKQFKMNSFAYTINENVMHCYHQKLVNAGEIDFYNNRKNAHFYAFVRGNVPLDLDICLYIIIDKKEKIKEFVDTLKEEGIDKDVDFVVYDYELDGYSYLKINCVKARKELAIKKIKDTYQTTRMVVCGSGHTDLPLMENADLSLCLASAADYVKEKADAIIVKDSPEAILKAFGKLYNSSNIDKKIMKIKKRGKI